MSPNGLSSALYQEIAKANEPRKFEAWHASSIADCPRAHYFKRKGVKAVTQPTAAKMLRWRAGHIMEGEIRPYLVKLYPKLESNKRLWSPELTLTGEFDNYDPDSQYLIEIKTVHDRAVRYMKVSEDRHHLRDDKPYIAHEWQQHAYVLLLGSAGKNVKGITYLYITLGGLLVPYMTGVREEITVAVLARLATLNAAWQAQEPPECICEESNPFWAGTLQYCDYRDEAGCCKLSLLKEK